ncbi:Zn-dependent hydrolase [Orrella sp. JC864]|uniref:Zn-dependent hydrolase n=1 Tax=Orrella sp. JC864 TaxID=3120298 RepID=UPI00300BE582
MNRPGEQATSDAPPLAIDAGRLWQRVQALARYTEPQRPWTRRAFGELHARSRQWLREQMVQAGLSVTLDAAGNLIGRRAGRQPALPPLMTGSHCDTVVEGGRFDGIIGVLAGIEIAHALNEQGRQLEHPLEVVDFLSEEPSDYGISCVGSRGMAGVLTPDMLACARPDGETLAQGLARCGGDPSQLPAAARAPGSIAAFVELHIEQGPVLEQRGIPIGVVSHIVGIRRVALAVQGRPDHAGTTPMTLRRDALVAAARIIDGTYTLAGELSGQPHYVVATVGRIEAAPNVPNAVPGHVELVLEIRSDDDGVLETFPDRLLQRVQAGVAATGSTVSRRELSRSSPTACDARVMRAVQAGAQKLGYEHLVLPSGAGHDAAYLARLGPAGMVFVPCLQGRSHCPEESITPAQLHDGTRVLAQALLELDAAGR